MACGVKKRPNFRTKSPPQDLRNGIVENSPARGCSILVGSFREDSESAAMHGLLDNGFKLIALGNDGFELYDMRNGPGETM